MVAKILVFFAIVAAASAVAVPVVPAVAKYAYAEPEAPAHYQFQYSVHDGQSGDVKQQQEARAGDAVQGSYSLVQPDGVHRIVDYTADSAHGFNAVVRYEGSPVAPAPVAKIAYAAPVAKVALPAPVAYAAPVAKVAYAAPVARLAYPAPVARVAYAAPAARVAYAPAPSVAYQQNLGHVSFASPAVSYSH